VTCGLFFRGLGLRFTGGLVRLVMHFSGRLSCLLARAIHGFVGFSGYGFAGFFCLLAYGLRSLFCFFANRFNSLLCFLTCCFQSVFNCFACFLRAVLYVLNDAVLAKRSQRNCRKQSSNQARDFHILFLLVTPFYYCIGLGSVIARTSNGSS